MDGAEAWILMVSALTVIFVCVESEQRVCYSGPPPEPDPDHPDDWMKQVMQEIRKRCPGRKEPIPTTKALCREPLGMETGAIPNEDITASSSEACCPASGARINTEARWIPDSPDNSWIEVNLDDSAMVSGVVTQGYHVGYVTHYRVAYQNQHASSYHYLMDGHGNKKVFVGNTAPLTSVTNMFDESVEAIAVRIEPTAWDGNVALRLELLGCRLD